MKTKTNSLRLTRGGFLTALTLSMVSAIGILQGCGDGGGGNDNFREMLIGVWRTAASNSVGKTLTLNADSTFSTSEPSGAGSWSSLEEASDGSSGIQLTVGGANRDVRVISVDGTTLKLSIDGIEVTYTKDGAPTPTPTPSPSPAPTASPSPAPTASPAPTPTPTPAVFTALPASITATHTVGGSPCPQTLGTVTVSNTGSGSISVTIPAVADLSFDKTSFTLAAGANTTVTVHFTCDNVPPLSKTITFNATAASGGASSSRTVSVQLNAG